MASAVKNINTFETKVATAVVKIIKESKEHAGNLSLAIRLATTFAIFHGRTNYLNQLGTSLSNTDKLALVTFLRNTNTEGVKSLFGEDHVLNALNDGKGVNLFSYSKEKGYTVATSESAKAVKKAMVETFKDEMGLVDALIKVPFITDREVEKAAFSMADYLSKVVLTLIRNESPIDRDKAILAASAINNIVPEEKRLTAHEIATKADEAIRVAREKEAAAVAEKTIQSVSKTNSATKPTRGVTAEMKKAA